MAFGDVKGTLTGATGSITNPFAATGSVTVAVGDLIVVAYGQRGTLTGGTVTDNLGHTYTAQNAGSDAGNSAGRAWWKIATAAGTLTSVSMTATASTEDVALAAVVYEGAFTASPLDASPANTTTSGGAKVGPATGTLAQADELVVNWANGTVGWTGGTLTVGTVDVTASSGTGANTEGVSIASLVVTATTSTQATWTLGGSAALVMGVMTFKKAAGGPTSYSDTITAGTVGIVGQAVVGVFGRTDAITAGTVGIVGQTVVPVFAVIEPLTPGTVGIVEQTIIPSFLLGGAVVFDFTLSDTLDSRITSNRGTSATYYDSSGVLQTVGLDVPRRYFDPVTGECWGLLVEQGKTNIVLWSRDLTNAAWTKTNITAAKDQTGRDAVSNSASSITATAANGTILQAITLASSARWQSASVKRLTGSGVVEMTMDGGATWTAITVTSSWTHVEIPTQTLANPSVGFRIVTSGDAIAIDLVQNEDSSTSASSYIPTTTAAVARGEDVVSSSGANFSSWYTNGPGTLVGHWRQANTSGTAWALHLSTDNIVVNRDGEFEGRAVSNTQQWDILGGAPTLNAFSKIGVAWDTNDVGYVRNGTILGNDTSAVIPTGINSFHIGQHPLFGPFGVNYYKKFTYYPVRKSDSELQTLTSTVVGYTDTITAGAVGIVGQTITPAFGRTDALTPGAVGIVGQTVTPVFGRTDALTPGTVGIVGQTVAPVFARFEPALTAGTVSIVGQTVTPVYAPGATGYTTPITAGTVSIVGQTVTPVFAITEALTAGTIGIVGQTVTPAFGRTDAIVAGTVGIVGQTIIPAFGRTDAIVAGTVGIVGQTVTPVFARTEAITAGAVPIVGQAITPVFSGGGINYSDTITAGTVPIVGQTVTPALAITEGVTAGAVPIIGQTIAPIFVAGEIDYTTTLVAGTMSITGATITPVYVPAPPIVAGGPAITLRGSATTLNALEGSAETIRGLRGSVRLTTGLEGSFG